MAQIQKGTEYLQGMAVTAANLNYHVDAAVLLPGCINEQPTAQSVASTNSVLISDGSSLSKATLASLITPLNLFDKSQPQTLGQNVSFASGADIALASGSIMALASGAQITLASGSSMTLSSGAILTLGQDPISAFQAVPKQYVDNGFLSKATGGLVSGSISMIGTSSILTLSADPLQPLQAATKQYVENWNTKEVASLRMRTPTAPGTTNTLITTNYISSSVSQTAGSNTVTFTVSNPALFNAAQPFFVAGQYIGTSSAIGTFAARLYKIETVNTANNTFTVTHTDTTAKTGSTNLTVMYANLTPPALPSMLDVNGNKNIKSVYLCAASNKQYINYWYDTETGSMTDAVATPSTQSTLYSTSVIGDAVTGSSATACQFLSCLQMRQLQNAAATLNLPYTSTSPTGFGVTSKGIHVGFFADTTTGCPQQWLHDCNVVIFR